MSEIEDPMRGAFEITYHLRKSKPECCEKCKHAWMRDDMRDEVPGLICWNMILLRDDDTEEKLDIFFMDEPDLAMKTHKDELVDPWCVCDLFESW